MGGLLPACWSATRPLSTGPCDSLWLLRGDETGCGCQPPVKPTYGRPRLRLPPRLGVVGVAVPSRMGVRYRQVWHSSRATVAMTGSPPSPVLVRRSPPSSAPLSPRLCTRGGSTAREATRAPQEPDGFLDSTASDRHPNPWPRDPMAPLCSPSSDRRTGARTSRSTPMSYWTARGGGHRRAPPAWGSASAPPLCSATHVASRIHRSRAEVRHGPACSLVAQCLSRAPEQSALTSG